MRRAGPGPPAHGHRADAQSRTPTPPRRQAGYLSCYASVNYTFASQSSVAGLRLDAHHKSGAWMQGRKLTHMDGIEDAEDVELPFLRDVRGVREEGEGDVHTREDRDWSPAALEFTDVLGTRAH